MQVEPLSGTEKYTLTFVEAGVRLERKGHGQTVTWDNLYSFSVRSLRNAAQLIEAKITGKVK